MRDVEQGNDQVTFACLENHSDDYMEEEKGGMERESERKEDSGQVDKNPLRRPLKVQRGNEALLRVVVVQMEKTEIGEKCSQQF